MRFAFFDIETTSLEGSYGRLLCACVKYSGSKRIETIRSRTLADELNALEEIRAAIHNCILVTWNGKMFDVPFVNQRLLSLDRPPLVPMLHLDHYWHHKKLRSRGHSLEKASLDLRCKNRKYDVTARVWQQAMDTANTTLSTYALDEIARHCRQDILILEEMHYKLAPLVQRITK